MRHDSVTTDDGCLIIIRHGQSSWNDARRFTGWGDPSLTTRGRVEAAAAGRALTGARMHPDVVFTSVLRRAQDTVGLVLEAMKTDVTMRESWRLNERHYGVLQGETHDDARRRYGAQQVERWRREWSAVPPPMSQSDPRHPIHDAKYANVDAADLPDAESLEQCLRRQLPCLQEISNLVRDGASVLLIGHGNSLRAVTAHLEHVSADAVPTLLIPTGEPRVYRLRDAWQREIVEFPVRGTRSGP
jgi:2,3-bisphosphoglycerate-dependent phosphoglycerate mutase